MRLLLSPLATTIEAFIEEEENEKRQSRSNENQFKLRVQPKVLSTSDHTLKTLATYNSTISEQRNDQLHADPSRRGHMDHNDAPLAEVYMTPMMDDDPSSASLSASRSGGSNSSGAITTQSSESSGGILQVYLDGGKNNILNHTVDTVIASSISLARTEPEPGSFSSPSRKGRSTKKPSTPNGLKPRPSFRSLQSKVHTTMASDHGSVFSSNQSVISGHSSHWPKQIEREIILPPHGEECMMSHRSYHGIRSLERFDQAQTWQFESEMIFNTPAASNRTSNSYSSSRNENESRQGLLPTTPKTPLLKSASAAKTAVGATVAESIKSVDTESQYSRGSRYSRDTQSSYQSSSCISSNASHKYGKLRGNNRKPKKRNNINTPVNFDVDGDYEPLTAVGKLVKELYRIS